MYTYYVGIHECVIVVVRTTLGCSSGTIQFFPQIISLAYNSPSNNVPGIHPHVCPSRPRIIVDAWYFLT